MLIKDKIRQVIELSLKKAPSEVNTDWFGTLLVDGLLKWNGLGYPQTAEYATNWLSFHIENHKTLRNEDFPSFSGRILRGYTLTLSTYAGYFGAGYACKSLHDLTGDKRAKQICMDIGDVILHHCARNNLGLVMHDDRENGFTIPDVAYFVVPPLFLAMSVDDKNAVAFKRQAEIQLKKFMDLFLDRDIKLVKTLYRDGRLGETYWIRANGWLLWAISEALDYVDRESALHEEIRIFLDLLAQGLERCQDPSGGFHLLIDDKTMPLETTGSIMIANSLHKAVRTGWLDKKYLGIADGAWSYVDTKIDDAGNLTGCYSGWALPAEERKLDFDRPMNWMPGMLLSAGAEFEKPIL